MENLKVLLVDDSGTMQKMVKMALSKIGIKNVETALNGIEGMASLKESTPDLILSDWNMPEMNGYEVCTKLKQATSTSNIPVIFVTAFDDLSGELKGFEVGGVDYITKPVVPEIVLARVKTHLKLKEVTEKLAKYALRMEKLADNKLDLDSPDA